MRVEERVPLRTLSTMKVGGEAAYLLTVDDTKDIDGAVAFARGCGIPFFVVGGGSNILFSDDGYSGAIIRITDSSTEWIAAGDDIQAIVSAGRMWDEFVEETVERGYRGVENLSGIPGTVGAAPIQNIGAYGAEAKDAIEWVEVFDPNKGKVVRYSKAECRFAYRDSIFKQERRWIVLRVAFRLSRDAAPNISYQDLKFWFCERGHFTPSPKEVREAVLAIRAKKLPDLSSFGTLGSFFKNPVVTAQKATQLQQNFPDIPLFDALSGMKKVSAAWLIDRVAGYRDVRRGDVGTWPQQALVIVNYGIASEQEVSKFAEEIATIVKVKTDIELEREVVTLSSTPTDHEEESSI